MPRLTKIGNKLVNLDQLVRAEEEQPPHNVLRLYFSDRNVEVLTADEADDARDALAAHFGGGGAAEVNPREPASAAT